MCFLKNLSYSLLNLKFPEFDLIRFSNINCAQAQKTTFNLKKYIYQKRQLPYTSSKPLQNPPTIASHHLHFNHHQIDSTHHSTSPSLSIYPYNIYTTTQHTLQKPPFLSLTHSTASLSTRRNLVPPRAR